MGRKLSLHLCCAVVCALLTGPLLAEPAGESETTAPPSKEAAPPLRLDVPLYRDVKIDAAADDWVGRGHVETQLVASSAVELDAADLSATMHLGWDEQGLAVLIVVQDDVAVESDDQLSVTDMDSVELLISDESAGGNKVRLALSPGRAEAEQEPRVRTWDYRQHAELRRTPIDAQTATRDTEDGYVVEVRIPWAALGIDARAGVEVGFAVEVHDADEGFRRDHVTLGPPDTRRSQGDPPVINRLILAPMRHELADRAADPLPAA